VAGSCEYDNAASVTLKGGEFRDQLSEYQLFKKDPVLCS